MTGFWIGGTVLVITVALADFPFAVIGGTALVVAVAGAAWEFLARRGRRKAEAPAARPLPARSLWSAEETDALDAAEGKASLEQLLLNSPALYREGKYL